MKTFTGKYVNGNFVLSSDNEVLKAMLVSILNARLGTRWYYPTYGSSLSDLKFEILNYYTINLVTQEIKTAVGLIEGISLDGISFKIGKDKEIIFLIDLRKDSTTFKVSLSVLNGVAS